MAFYRSGCNKLTLGNRHVPKFIELQTTLNRIIQGIILEIS